MRVKLIDASGYVFRAYYALPPLVRPSDNLPVNALYGYCNMLWSLVQEGECTHMAVILDGGRSGRDEIDPAYKANRKPKPEELITQLRLVEDATASFGIPTVKIDGMEADDVIATYARTIGATGGEALICSSDKDLMQLLTEPNVGIYDPLKKQVVTDEVCIEKMGVEPHQVADYLALVGDAADNIPGVNGIGPKAAAYLLQTHGDLESILAVAERSHHTLGLKPAQAGKLAHPDSHAAARLSRRLVELKMIDGLPDVDLLTYSEPDPERLRAYLREMEFMVLERDVAQRYSVAA